MTKPATRPTHNARRERDARRAAQYAERNSRIPCRYEASGRRYCISDTCEFKHTDPRSAAYCPPVEPTPPDEEAGPSADPTPASTTQSPPPPSTLSKEVLDAGADALFYALQGIPESRHGNGWRYASAVGSLYSEMNTKGCPFRDARNQLLDMKAIERDRYRDTLRLTPRPEAPPVAPSPTPPPAAAAPAPVARPEPLPSLPPPSPLPASTAPTASPTTSPQAARSGVRRECPQCLSAYDLDDVHAVVCGHVFCGTCAPSVKKRKSCIICDQPVAMTVRLIF